MPMKHVLLVVDDDELMLELTSTLCRQGLPDVKVVTASTGTQALQLARVEKPGVVVLDVKLPDIDGLEVCRQIRRDAVTANTHILMVTGILMEAKDRIRGIESGADAYLFKPFDPAELLLQIKTLFRWWEAEQTQLEHLEGLVAQRTQALAAANTGLQSEIAARKQAEVGLRESEERFRQLFTEMSSGFALHEIICDEDGRPCDYRFLEINHAFETMTGLRREQLLGRTVLEVLPATEEYWIETYGRVALTGERVRFENFAQALGKHFEVVAYRPAPRQFAVMINDITERKRVEAENQRLAMAVEQAAESIAITDLEGTILYVNPALEQSSGYTRAELLGQNPRLLKSGKQDAAFYQQMWGTLLRGEMWQGTVINRRKDGALYEEEATISPIRNATGTVTNYVAIKLDVTRERQLEGQIQQSQKMESIGRLAGGVAHDFNNILQSIIGFSEILLADLAPGQAHFEEATEIQKAADRAAGLTRQLLAFSRRQLIVPTVLNLNDVVSNMHKMLHRLIGEDIQLVTKLAADLWRVKADAGQIEQVVMNLAVNARDAMPHGGRITVTSENVALQAEDVQYSTDARAGQFVRLTVSDTGTGIPPAILPRIFEPFFSTKGPGQGSGLGLSVVYGIAQQNNGWVHVYSQVGQGSAFKLYLPVHLTAESAAAPTAAQARPPRGHGERILVVEDEPEIRRLAERVLRDAGYEVVLVGNAGEAYATFEREGGRFDMVFSDVVLPDENGIAVVEHLVQRKPGLAVLLCSGYTDERSRWQLIAEKKYPFLHKPYPAVELLRTLHTIFDARPRP